MKINYRISKHNQFFFLAFNDNYNKRKEHEDEKAQSKKKEPRVETGPLQKVEELLSSNAFEEITSRKLQFSLDHSFGYIVHTFSKKESGKKKDLKKAMEIWHPDKFFPRYGHRIPNEEEEVKIKAIVNHVSAALISGYQK